MSGRIADVVLEPDDPNVWYVAVGSGGVWKTENAGTTWKSLFDGQGSYSIGCITLDPSNPHVVWVGTGENVGGRHVGYGDGVYRSGDGGKSWTNVGLKRASTSRRSSCTPRTRTPCGWPRRARCGRRAEKRGLYKTTDGGKTWRQVLSAGPWTGVTDLVIDPRDPDVLYAATWQRHRTVAAYVGGGPESGIHKSTDGGETWTRLDQGPTRRPGAGDEARQGQADGGRRCQAGRRRQHGQDRTGHLAAQPRRAVRRDRAQPSQGRGVSVHGPRSVLGEALGHGRGRNGPRTTTRSCTPHRTPRAASTWPTCACESPTTAARHFA